MMDEINQARKLLNDSKDLFAPYVEKFVQIIEDYIEAVPPIHKDFIKKFFESESLLLQKDVIFRHDINGFPTVMPAILLYQIIYKHSNHFLTQEFATQFPLKWFYEKYKPVSKKFQPISDGFFQRDKLTEMFFDFMHYVHIHEYFLFKLKPGDVTKESFELIIQKNGDLINDQMNFRVERKSYLWEVMTFVFRLIDLLIVIKNDFKTDKLFKVKNIYGSLTHLYLMRNMNKDSKNLIVDAFLKTLFNINRSFLGLPVV